MGYNGSIKVVFGRILSGSKGVVVLFGCGTLKQIRRIGFVLVSVHLILGYSSPFPIRSRTKAHMNRFLDMSH